MNLNHPDEVDKGLQAQTEDWDVIVIGAGMGGGTTAARLAQLGHKVLLLEKGLWLQRQLEDSANQWTETPRQRMARGRWPVRVNMQVDGAESNFFAALGCGVGGSTLLYAAALERFLRSDMENDIDVPGVTPGTRWPITYDEFKPWYREAEALFGIRGSRDPLDAEDDTELLEPRDLAERDLHFIESFQKLGLHPYHLHVGFKKQQGCEECLGKVCNQRCKVDADSDWVLPAAEKHGLTVLDRCEVQSLQADAKRVNEIVCLRNARTIRLRSKMVVLAAGAMFTPVLLLKSANEHWPNGLANGSDMVGRNLMFHISDLVALWPRGQFAEEGAKKTISVKDFYQYEGQKLGSFQSTGLAAGYGNILYFLKNKFDVSPFRHLVFVRPLLRIPAKIAAKLYGRAALFATILEDFPYAENRVALDASKVNGMQLRYRISDDLKRRNNLLRQLLKRQLKVHRPMFMETKVNLNHGHSSGTCRFGNDPQYSVLDRNNKAHEVENLYVVDASFFPTSAGVNPSLTIAANALRVSHHIDQQLKTSVTGSAA